MIKIKWELYGDIRTLIDDVSKNEAEAISAFHSTCPAVGAEIIEVYENDMLVYSRSQSDRFKKNS